MHWPPLQFSFQHWKVETWGNYTLSHGRKGEFDAALEESTHIGNADRGSRSKNL